MFKVAGVTGFRKADSISKHVTKYCHTKHGMQYDTIRGASGFNVTGGGMFNLTNYIRKEGFGKLPNMVNCYDQAAAVQAFCGCLGVKSVWKYSGSNDDPNRCSFGYINETNLVGVGPCNNPFYKSNKTTPVVPVGDVNRTGFGNHAFIETEGTKHIRDACAGPHTGAETLRQYLEASIDVKRTSGSDKKEDGKIHFDLLETQTLSGGITAIS
jgi:hypothetical protein